MAPTCCSARRSGARRWPSPTPGRRPDPTGDAPPDAAKVLRTFFRGGRLTSIPTSHAKRLVILDRLAQEFEPGVRYSERQVNARLRPFHEDVAALRRYLGRRRLPRPRGRPLLAHRRLRRTVTTSVRERRRMAVLSSHRRQTLERVMALVGQCSAASSTRSRWAVGVADDDGDHVVADVEDLGGPVDAVARAHAPLAVDLDLHGRTVSVSRPERRSVPGVAPVGSPPSTTVTPLTSTRSMPVASEWRRQAPPGRS